MILDNNLEKIASIYASALLEIAIKENILSDIFRDIKSITDRYLISKDLLKFLSNPVITKNIKKKFLTDVLAKDVNILILHFFFVLVEKNRINLLFNIFLYFQKLYLEYSSIEKVQLITPIEFSDIQKQSLIDKLIKLRKVNKIELTMIIQPDLIGGFKIIINSDIIDLSLRNQLKLLQVYLT
uniref:ATP synthase CF1 delta subunit n=1 Tax=Cyanidium sp. THAL103 TaxID=3027999 RepID=A0A9Y1MY91_9RHOD|nr:ATP synthase CF1 delta subunit [Cyanidium sp. THAL103]